jgi:CRP/FNR family cyclic AMP-dependent transcriptional regulator
MWREQIEEVHGAAPADDTWNPRRDTEALLDLDPELGALVRGERVERARRDLQVQLRAIPRGPFDAGALLTRSAADIGVLIVSGVVMRQTDIHREPSGELLGPGDLVRPTPRDAPVDSFQGDTQWLALTPLKVAPIGTPVTVTLCRYPEVLVTLMERVEARARRLTVTQGISQLTGVELRLETLLWHLADRWGKVTPGGVLLPLDLSHRMLGILVGARRPTVSTAAALLAAQGRVSRLADGTWFLPNAEPERSIARQPIGVAMAG